MILENVAQHNYFSKVATEDELIEYYRSQRDLQNQKLNAGTTVIHFSQISSLDNFGRLSSVPEL